MLTALRRHWLLAVLSALAAFAGCVGALAAVPSSYTATSVVAMVPEPESEAGADLLLLTIPNYAALATSQATATVLSATVGGAPDEIQSAIRVDNPPSSNTVLVSVSWGDPQTAADLANAVTEVIVESTRTDKVLDAQVVADATPPSVASWPPWRGGLVLGGLLALAVGLIAARVAEYRRRRIAAPEEVARILVEQQLPAPVLLPTAQTDSTVPVFLADLVGDALAGREGTATARIGVLVVGRDGAQRLTALTRAAALLQERGRRVLIALDEHDKAPVRPGTLALRGQTGTAAVEIVPLAELDSGQARRKRPAVVLVVSDRPERITDHLDPSALGVLTVVLGQASVQQLRAGLRQLRRAGVAQLAAVTWQGPAAPAPERVSDEPSRPASAPAVAPRVPGRAAPSAAGTSRSS